MDKIKKFFQEVRAEMRKVTWPTLKEARSGTVAVLVLSAVVAIFLWVVDLGLSQLVRALLGW